MIDSNSLAIAKKSPDITCMVNPTGSDPWRLDLPVYYPLLIQIFKHQNKTWAQNGQEIHKIKSSDQSKI